MHLTKLTRATTLFLMAVVSTSLLGNSLTIRNTWLFESYIEFFVVFQTPLQRAEMELTLSSYDYLAQFLALINNPSRVFLAHLQECSHQFLCILNIGSLDST